MSKVSATDNRPVKDKLGGLYPDAGRSGLAAGVSNKGKEVAMALREQTLTSPVARAGATRIDNDINLLGNAGVATPRRKYVSRTLLG